MSVRFKRYVLLALLVLVPLQGVAATVHALACIDHEDHAAVSLDHGHAGADEGTAHHHGDETAGGGNDHGGQSCCHHFSAAPVYVPVEPAGDRTAFVPSISRSERSAILERPQRPPRA